MYILFFSVFLFIIGLIFFIIGIKKQNIKLEKLEEKKRIQLETKIHSLTDECKELAADKDKLTLERDMVLHQRSVEKERLEEQRAQLLQLKEQSRELLATEHERLKSEMDLARQVELQKLKENYKAQNEELELQFREKKNLINEELAAYQEQLEEFRGMSQAINEAILRKKELEEQEFFYSIDISENDQEDISILQSMDARLHNRDVIPKLIWELFVRRPTQEMIKRVVGNEKIGGIYKITYKQTGEAYIGKTTDFSTRWQNHIKTAIGLEAAARSTLHTRMAKDGIWNYTFEILEKVGKDQLASRESYYIDLYGTKNQLNMKSGEKNGTQ